MNNNKKYIKIQLTNIIRTNNIYKKEYQDELINKFIKQLNNIKLKTINIPIPKIIKDKKIHQLRIVPNKYGNYFEVEMTYEYEKENKKINDNKYLNMELVINNLCACVDSNNESFIIDGKKLKSYNQFFNNGKIETYFNYNKKLWNNENVHILNTYQSICTIRSCYYAMETFIKRKKHIPHYLSKEGYYPLITDQIRLVMINNKKYIKLPLSNIVRKNNI